MELLNSTDIYQCMYLHRRTKQAGKHNPYPRVNQT